MCFIFFLTSCLSRIMKLFSVSRQTKFSIKGFKPPDLISKLLLKWMCGMQYKYGSHTLSQIESQFVWVTKYRDKVFRSGGGL